MADNAITIYKNASTILHDAVKTLRTNIQFSSVDKPMKTIVLTSVVPHDGKSTLSIFLGIAMAESGQRTLLIECDCRRPMLQNYLKLRPAHGLMDVLRNQIHYNEAIIPTSVSKLDLLSSTLLANPVEILGSARFQSMIEELKNEYDILLLDTPPLGSFIEAAILGANADGTILVLQAGSTEIEAAKSVVAQLEKANANLIGVVLNNVEMTGGDYYYSDYYYRGGKKKHKKKKRSDRGDASSHISEQTTSPENAKQAERPHHTPPQQAQQRVAASEHSGQSQYVSGPRRIAAAPRRPIEHKE